MTTFHLPDLGEGLQDAEIVSWHVTLGDHVVADQPLVSVETDKAVVEVPSPQSGVIAQMFGAVGERVDVGAPLVAFEAQGSPDTGAVVGTLPDSERPQAAPVITTVTAQTGTGRATPAVRALAKSLGVELSAIAPSGTGGTITKADVKRVAEALNAAPAPEPLRGVRRAMADRMARTHAEVVPATIHDQADLDPWPTSCDVTLVCLRALAQACAQVPMLNAWFDGAKLERRLHDRVDVGLAVNSPDGLFVPVIQDIARLTDKALRALIDRAKAEVHARTITPERLRGATITFSNFGAFPGKGGRHAAMVVTTPQVAIIGTGRIEPRVVVANGAPAVHRCMPVSLTFDHRAATGAEASAFLAAFIAHLENFRQ